MCVSVSDLSRMNDGPQAGGVGVSRQEAGSEMGDWTAAVERWPRSLLALPVVDSVCLIGAFLRIAVCRAMTVGEGIR